MASRPAPASPGKKGAKSASPAVGPSQVAQAWSGGKIPRVVLILGPETALREEALAGLRKAAFPQGDGGLNWIVLYGPEQGGSGEGEALKPSTVLDEACTVPMFAAPDEPKVVVVRKADLFLNEAETREVFERNMARIPDCAVLVFEVAQPGKLKTTRLYKQLQELGAVVACEALASAWGPSGPDSPLAGELAARAGRLGLRLNAGAAMALIERSGQNLGVLCEELAKLALVLGAGEGQPVAVDEDAIAQLCAPTRLGNPFEFAEALCARETRKALESLDTIFAHGLGDYRKPGKVVTNETNIGMRLLAAVTWKLTQLQDVQALLESGVPESAAMEQAKVFRAAQYGLRRGLKAHPGPSLRNAMEALLRANLALRSGSTPQAALEQLALEVCRGQPV